MIEILILAAILTAKINGFDREYAKRGELPPSYRMIDKWLDGRKARGQAPASARPAKYGLWRYAWQRWCAMWEMLSLRHEAEMKARREAAARGELPPPRPSWRQRVTVAWQYVIDHIQAPTRRPDPQPGPAVPAPEAVADEPPAEPRRSRPRPAPTPDGPARPAPSPRRPTPDPAPGRPAAVRVPTGEAGWPASPATWASGRRPS